MSESQSHRPLSLVVLAGGMMCLLAAIAVISVVPLVECPEPYHKLVHHWGWEKIDHRSETICDTCGGELSLGLGRITLLKKWMFDWNRKQRHSF